MAEFNPQPVPDPIISPNAPLPPGPDQPGFMGALKNFYRNNKWYVWAIVLGVVIIGVLAFIAFRPQKIEPTKAANVEVSIDAPETAPSGGEVIYKVKIENHDKAKLVDMNLELVYPEGSSYVSSTPKAENLSGSRFSVPDLSNGQNAVVIIKTLAEGNVNDDKELHARLHYHFDNFNSEFVAEASHTVRLVAADVVLDVTGPETTTNAQVASYDIFYRNSSDKPINNARIQVTYPEGFSYGDSNPKPSLGSNVWNIGTLNPEGTGKISFQGSFRSAQPGQSLQFKIEFLVLDAQGNFFTQAGTTFTTTISSQPLVVTQSVQGSGSEGIVNPGDTISYEIKYQNNTGVVATGVSVVSQLDSKALDLSTIRAESGQVQDSTITWNGSSVQSLERLNPNESGTIRFTVQVKNPASKDGSKNLSVISHVKMRSNENSSFLPGPDLTLKISSPGSLSGSTTHVSGQLPPRVGQNSTFNVVLSLKNATNDYFNSTLTASIPIGVVLDQNSITAKEKSLVKYDSSTGKLTWSMGTLSGGTGYFSPVRQLAFNVTIKPSSNQVGQSVTLLKNITFTAKDSYTAQSINLTTETITTNNIPNNSGSGTVIP